MEAAKKIQGRKRAGVHDVMLHEQARHFFVYNAPPGHTVDDMLVPEYWANEAKKFRLFDRIELRAEDASFWAEAIVVAKGEGAVKLHILEAHDLSGQKQTFDNKLLDEYDISYRGLKGWSVVRKSDKHMVSSGHDGEEAAKKALTEHLQSMSR